LSYFDFKGTPPAAIAGPQIVGFLSPCWAQKADYLREKS
jgi:hypothetical protein